MTGRVAADAIRLRPLAAADEALYVALYSDPETMRHVGAALPRENACRSFRTALRANLVTPPAARVWVIERETTRQALGLIGLQWSSATSAELGVVLPPQYQAKGFAQSAIRALMAPAFAELGLARLHTRHAESHALARGLMASLGFSERQRVSTPRACAWEMTAEDWHCSSAKERACKARPPAAVGRQTHGNPGEQK